MDKEAPAPTGYVHQQPPGPHPPPFQNVVLVKREELSWQSGFCFALVITLVLSPIFAVLLLLAYGTGRGRYGVYGGIGAGLIIYGGLSLFLALNWSVFFEAGYTLSTTLFYIIAFLSLACGIFLVAYMRSGLRNMASSPSAA
jgi:hypothetical protein